MVQTYTILALRRAETARLGELKASLSYVWRLSCKQELGGRDGSAMKGAYCSHRRLKLVS